MENCLYPKKLFTQTTYYKYRPNVKKNEGRYITVPCGKCMLCLNSRRMNWLMRIEMEHKYTTYPNQWFLTLTYNEKKVPRKKGVRTLYKRHPQLFLKRLRKSGHKIKYILVGEYGGKTQRPHYHAIAWTTAPPEVIDRCWNYGHVHYRKIARESILYTLKYILEPRQGDNEIKQREYAVFSKGLGLAYMSENMYNWHNKGLRDVKMWTVLDGRKVPLPRYYREKIFTKYQRSLYAEKMYYTSLKGKMDAIRRFKELGYKSAFKAYKDHVKAAHDRISYGKKRSKSKL